MVWPQIWLRDCRHNVPASSEGRSVIWQYNLKNAMFEATYKYIYVLWQRFRRQTAGGKASWAMYVDGRGHHLQAMSPRRIAPSYAVLDPTIDLEFNAYFLNMALTEGCSVVERPVTFHPRVGVSRGGTAITD